MTRPSTTRIAALLIVLGLAAVMESAHADDNWRRTAQGWEKIENWQQPQAATSPARPISAEHIGLAARWDTHPAALALIQLAAVLAAMIVFPRPSAARCEWLEDDWRAVLRRSFRASVFGS